MVAEILIFVLGMAVPAYGGTIHVYPIEERVRDKKMDHAFIGTIVSTRKTSWKHGEATFDTVAKVRVDEVLMGKLPRTIDLYYRSACTKSEKETAAIMSIPCFTSQFPDTTPSIPVFYKMKFFIKSANQRYFTTPDLGSDYTDFFVNETAILYLRKLRDDASSGKPVAENSLGKPTFFEPMLAATEVFQGKIVSVQEPKRLKRYWQETRSIKIEVTKTWKGTLKPGDVTEGRAFFTSELNSKTHLTFLAFPDRHKELRKGEKWIQLLLESKIAPTYVAPSSLDRVFSLKNESDRKLEIEKIYAEYRDRVKGYCETKAAPVTTCLVRGIHIGD